MMTAFNRRQNHQKLEDRLYLNKQVAEGCRAKDAFLMPRDFKAITWAYNLKSKYLWDKANPKNPQGFLPRGYNTMHSLICKDLEAFSAQYGHLFTDWAAIKAKRIEEQKKRRSNREAKQAAQKAAEDAAKGAAPASA
ncbi:hypothetical protein ONS95_011527 [Cadophora gregata]|uniref:uncharacterized protein n=1 Tax=Cadophora gregata TaxID=51156 RepID=UPI0026DCC956|nr:uncharacterized protein ONS95_011527 [Cadophora gregata]KAK0120119.1 hypothetical protein ONS95_011527 [Cadophora gregata]KAK0121147.1 hypothetical protein ONS96_011326 [Cadophora gregata f. sp. sojae]